MRPSQWTSMKTYYVYMLFCIDGTYYVGMTSDLEKRVAQHTYGAYPDCYTYSRRPVTLAYSSSFSDVIEAIDAEKKLKRWSHRKKAALARSDWKALNRCSRGRSR
jgi:predicted GIY-YIG superfamily endonuclease